MKIKLLREVLIGASDVTPARGGTVVEMDEASAKEFIALGLAEEEGKGSSKAVDAAAKNKMVAAPKNKARGA